MKAVCRVPQCGTTTIHLRGLCRSCYLFAASLVFHKLSSWEKLEKAGCVAPTNGQGYSIRRPERTEWFAKGIGLNPEVLTMELKRRSKEYAKANHDKHWRKR